MIRIDFNDDGCLTDASKSLLTLVIRHACPGQWKHRISEVVVGKSGVIAAIFPNDGSKDFVDVKIHNVDGALSDLEFLLEDGTTESWTATPLNEHYVMDAIEAEKEDEDFGVPKDAVFCLAVEGLFCPDEEMVMRTIPWKTHNEFLSEMEPFWSNALYTVLNYFKNNKITSTDIYTVDDVTSIIKDDGNLFAINEFDEKTPFVDLTIGRQLSIVEELLKKAECE